jgi:hypothetical protein
VSISCSYSLRNIRNSYSGPDIFLHILREREREKALVISVIPEIKTTAMKNGVQTLLIYLVLQCLEKLMEYESDLNSNRHFLILFFRLLIVKFNDYLCLINIAQRNYVDTLCLLPLYILFKLKMETNSPKHRQTRPPNTVLSPKNRTASTQGTREDRAGRVDLSAL